MSEKEKKGADTPKDKVKYPRMEIRISNEEIAELKERVSVLKIDQSKLLKKAGIHSHLHTLKRLLSVEEALPDKLHLRLDAKSHENPVVDKMIILYHYPAFNGKISRFEYFIEDRSLHIVFKRNQIYEFGSKIADDVLIECLKMAEEILVVQMDEKMENPVTQGCFAPLLLYRNSGVLYSLPKHMMQAYPRMESSS